MWNNYLSFEQSQVLLSWPFLQLIELRSGEYLHRNNSLFLLACTLQHKIGTNRNGRRFTNLLGRKLWIILLPRFFLYLSLHRVCSHVTYRTPNLRKLYLISTLLIAQMTSLYLKIQVFAGSFWTAKTPMYMGSNLRRTKPASPKSEKPHYQNIF